MILGWLRAIWFALIARRNTRDFHDEISRDYDRLVLGQPNTSAVAQVVVDYGAALGLGLRNALELGCGTGLFAQHLRGNRRRIYGVDFSWGQLVQAQSKRLGICLVQADVLALPYVSNRFDLVTSFQVLPHVPGDEAALFAEAYRVLKPGGMLFVDPAALR